ncbi:Retrovirus-related Pol polyprotein LINE-1 [Gossypium australe]|uniref:Retrovirus-related Pol polyprotein LINE-1 n=1 Tax=Gossypium australe TaxID=47621 RepID=A0A5B6UXN6_9ROSI|nr:Retrovirus-related Pol polyprotein LINE-1 [Gossypium australe]
MFYINSASIGDIKLAFEKATSFSLRVPKRNLTHRLANCLVQNLGTYLGVHLFHNRVPNNTVNFVVDKVRCKLQSWEARKLSIAGRVTLTQSILLLIPNYFMQSMLIPKGVCVEIERIVRKYIWEALEDI